MKQSMAIFLAFNYVALSFYEASWFQWLIAFVVLLFIFLSIPSLKGMPARLISLLGVLTVLLLIGQENWLDTIRNGALVNLTVIAIFVLTPLLGIPFRTSGYIESLRSILHKKRNSVSFFYISTAFLTHLLGAILNVGAISINYYLSGVSNVRSNRIIANALNRGFAGAVAWSPYFAAMALVVSQLHIQWTSIALYAAGFSLLSFWIGFLIEWKVIQQESSRLVHMETSAASSVAVPQMKRRLTELVLLLASITGTVLLIEHFTPFNMIVSIAFTAVLFPAAWCISKGAWLFYKEELKKHVAVTLLNLNQEISLFLLAGIFSAAFVSSKWSDLFISSFSQLFGNSPVLMTIILSVIIVGAAMAGLHPIVIVTILITSINPKELNFSTQYFALALLGSWSISNVLSPATAVNNLIAFSLKEKVSHISVKWNWLYGLVMIVLLPFYLFFIQV